MFHYHCMTIRFHTAKTTSSVYNISKFRGSTINLEFSESLWLLLKMEFHDQKCFRFCICTCLISFYCRLKFRRNPIRIDEVPKFWPHLKLLNNQLITTRFHTDKATSHVNNISKFWGSTISFTFPEILWLLFEMESHARKSFRFCTCTCLISFYCRFKFRRNPIRIDEVPKL